MARALSAYVCRKSNLVNFNYSQKAKTSTTQKYMLSFYLLIYLLNVTIVMCMHFLIALVYSRIFLKNIFNR